MGRQIIKDERLRTLGYIEPQPDGRLKAVNAQDQVIGWYDPAKDVTLGPDMTMIGPGDRLAELLFEEDQQPGGGSKAAAPGLS